MNTAIPLKKHYQGLSTTQKDLLKLLALIDAAETQSRILQISLKAKLKTAEKRSYNANALQRDLEQLRIAGFAKKNIEQKYQVHPDVYDFSIRQAVADRRLSTFRKGILQLLPGISQPNLAAHQPAQIVRDASFAVYTNNYSMFKQALDLLKKDPTFYVDALYKKLFIERYGLDQVGNLSPKLQVAFYKSQLNAMILSLKNVDSLLESIRKINHQLPKKEQTAINHHLSLHAVLQGNWSVIADLWAQDDSVEGLQFTAWSYFARGYNHKAIQWYEKALATYRKKKKSYKGYFKDYHGIIYILALLKDHNQQHIHRIRQFLKEIFSATQVTNGYLFLASAVDSLEQNTSRAEELFSQEHLYYNLDGLLYLYAQYWSQVFAPNWENYAHTLQHKAIKNGYYWVAYNVAELAQSISKERAIFYEGKALELRKIIGYIPSLMDVIGLQEDWEVALQALETIQQDPIRRLQNQQSRLVWLVDFEQELLQPKIQRINKNGKWSKGRNVGLDKLAEGAVQEASSQDLKIIQTIQKLASPAANGQTHAFLNPAQTFRALVDHPLLFLYKAPDVACELHESLVELVVRETEQGYQLAPSIDIKREGYYLVKETSTRYRYIYVSDKQLQLAQTLGKQPLTIPFKGKARLEQVLVGLSAIMPLQSDLEVQDDIIPSIEADQRLYVHLLPVGDGFYVECFVRPFQAAGPYFKPGAGSARVVAKIDDIRTQVKRDLEVEVAAVAELLAACPILEVAPMKNELWHLEDPYLCLELLRDLEPLKQADKIVVEWPKGERLKIKRQIGFDSLQLSIQKEHDWFELSGKVQVNENLVLDMRKLLQMMQHQPSNFIQLDDGQFLALSEQLQKRLDTIYKLTDDDGRIHPLASVAFDELTDDIEQLTVDQAWKQQVQQLQTVEQKKAVVPETLKATLRPYQLEGYQWLARLANWGVGACLADDMGLGKTIQALAIILKRAELGPALVVAPASVCRNWVKEIDKFAPSLTPILFSESDRKKSLADASPRQVLITTYGLLQTESKGFQELEFSTIVLDEAQAIKNSNAKRSQAAMKLNGSFKVITTGTPIENHLGELWNLFRFINPGLLGSMKGFKNRFAIPIEKERNVRTQEQLQQLIRPFILRRHKRDVLKELPEKTEITLNVDLSEAEQSFYEALRREAVESLTSNPELKAGTQHLKVLAQIMRLRRACCNPRLVDEQSNLESSKLKLFGTIVEELIANGHKALVFSQFVGHLRLIEEYLQQKNIRYQYLDGQTPNKQRQQRIDAFQAGDGDLFLISLKAGGTGLNLTAADYVIHMDPWWNPAVEDQASDRAHRIGQKRPVTVYRLITTHTIEEKIIRLHEDKRDLADSLLQGTDSSSKLSANDLLNLIKYQ